MECFKEAFSPNVGLCRHTCECGTTYYDDFNNIDWEEGELEALEKDGNSISIDHSIGILSVHGKEYCWDCNCWHDYAWRVINFINDHRFQVADFINRLTKVRRDEASREPEVTKAS